MSINIETLMQYIGIALTVLGIFAGLVSVIVECIKDLPKLKDLPTSLVVLAVSLILCIVALIAGCQILKYALCWYMIAGSIVLAFLVYIIATGGWDRLKVIWDRTKYKKTV